MTIERSRVARRAVSIGFGVLMIAVAVTVYAAGGNKRTAEKCTDDNECSKGHCYTKKNGDKVCVDCSSSKIGDTRGQIEKFCKNAADYPRKCDNIPRLDEAPENYFTIRIENGDRCIAVRKDENSSCWDGGDQEHQDQVDQAERGRKNCYDELNTRKGNGGIYTCSDSTYSSQAATINNACSSYGKACEDWSKDNKAANCRDIEDAMKKAEQCVVAVERLDSDCLPRLGSWRETQFAKAKKAYDYCKDVLSYKNSNKLCK